jgi:endonuclease YncB( thermonuclease family)
VKNRLLACALLLAACGPSQELLNTQATLSVMQTALARPTVFPDTATTTPTHQPKLAGTTAPTSAKSNEQVAVVVRIVDGDTIDVQFNNQTARVRYIGINTPERNENCFDQATQANSDMDLDKTVLRSSW